MEPGPELDAAVCMAVGIEPTRKWDRAVQDYEETYPPASTDETAAFRVVQAMREKGFAWRGDIEGGRAFSLFHTPGDAWSVCTTELPHAICRAALKALGVDPC